MIPNVLAIGGTDPSGGAGLCADLKTFAALGVYGMAVVTAVLAQNGKAVHRVQPMPAALVAAQIDAAFEDARIDAVKIGMLATAPIARIVAARLRRHRARHIVLDPVLAATAGARLLDADALCVLRDELLPLAELLTPNLAEAAVLLDLPMAGDLPAMQATAARLHATGPAWVLLKGGHLGGAGSPDVLHGADGARVFHAPRLCAHGDRGTGCTLAAAIAALRPRQSMPAAVSAGKRYVEAALRASGQLAVGRDRAPLQHRVHADFPAVPVLRLEPSFSSRKDRATGRCSHTDGHDEF